MSEIYDIALVLHDPERNLFSFAAKLREMGFINVKRLPDISDIDACVQFGNLTHCLVMYTEITCETERNEILRLSLNEWKARHEVLEFKKADRRDANLRMTHSRIRFQSLKILQLPKVITLNTNFVIKSGKRFITWLRTAIGMIMLAACSAFFGAAASEVIKELDLLDLLRPAPVESFQKSVPPTNLS